MIKFAAFLLLFLPIVGYGQSDTLKIYHPEADAKADVAIAVRKAAEEQKHVFLMIGGDWCRWCKMFDKFLNSNAGVDSALQANYIFQHVNFSKENKNSDLMADLEFPQRFGFPVFVILDNKGKRIHTQNSAYLEKGEGYDASKVIEFFDQWSLKALDSANYKK